MRNQGKFPKTFPVLKFSRELMWRIKVLCIVVPGMDFGMSYDVQANMLGAVFTTIQTAAKTMSPSDNEEDDRSCFDSEFASSS